MYSVAYLENYSDDILLLIDYLVAQEKESLTLSEIFADIGLDKLNGNFKKTNVDLVWLGGDNFEREWHYAIDLAVYLAALLLECQKSGSVDLADLSDDLEESRPLRITAAPEDGEMLNRALKEFAANPTAYDFSEMVLAEELEEIAQAAEAICAELYGA